MTEGKAFSTLTVTEAAAALGVDPSRVRLLIRQGRLPAERHGGIWLLDAAAVAAFERRPSGRPQAPKGYTNAPSRKLSVYLAPYQEEWVRTEAREQYPGAPLSGTRSQVSCFLRALVSAAMPDED